MRTTATRPIYRSRWWMPGFSLSLGLIMLVAFWTGDKPGDGLMALGVMTAVAALGAVGGLAYIVIVAALRRRG